MGRENSFENKLDAVHQPHQLRKYYRYLTGNGRVYAGLFYLCNKWEMKKSMALLSAEPYKIRNAIFAHHGKIFKSQDLTDHFSKYEWYNPSVENVSMEELNEIEKANLRLIQSYENK